MTRQPTCPVCRVAMDLGFQLDVGHHSSQKQAAWVEGPIEKTFWQAVNTKNRAVLPITTYRCPRCGFLTSFANEASGSASS